MTDKKSTPPLITAIIAAYNEEPRLAAVLQVVTTYPGFAEVLLVDDGSTDGTGTVAQQFPLTYLKNQTNQGKGAALDRAVSLARGNTLFLCDADVAGLTHDTISAILSPVLKGEVDVSIAMRYHGILRLFPWLLYVVFCLGGERALTKKVWQSVPAYYKHQFRIEPALNFYAVHYHHGLTYAYFPALRQPTKAKKMGPLNGNRRRLAFIGQVIGTALRLRVTFLADLFKTSGAPSPSTKDRR